MLTMIGKWLLYCESQLWLHCMQTYVMEWCNYILWICIDHVCYMSYPSHPPLFEYSNNVWRRVQTVELFSMECLQHPYLSAEKTVLQHVFTWINLYSVKLVNSEFKGPKRKEVFWFMKNLYNSKIKKKRTNNLLKKIRIAPVGVICGRLSLHHCHKLLFHVV
jgi:hypothetical protein